MKCNCGGEFKERRGDVAMEEAGMQVTLAGVTIYTCSKCGNETHGIPRMSALYRSMAEEFAKKRSRLMPKEIQFMREHLGLSQKSLAAKLGVNGHTVSKWEREDDPQAMGPQAERGLRLMVLLDKKLQEVALEEMATEAPRRQRMRWRSSAAGWEMERGLL